MKYREEYNTNLLKEQPRLMEVIAVVGPTAAGKTGLARQIAERIGGRLISADARQIYKGMDIGTNKESIDIEYKGTVISGFGIDVVEPNQEYSVYEFLQGATAVVYRSFAEGYVPIIVGGTALWVKALAEGYVPPKVEPDERLRAQLQKILETEGREALAEKLLQQDEHAGDTIDLQNPRRVIRALEVLKQTGSPIAELQKKKQPSFRTHYFIPTFSQQELEERIEKRTRKMFDQGLIEEGVKIQERYPDAVTALSAIGYAEVMQYKKGERSKEETIEAVIRNTKKYAKRQMTWWKHDTRVISIGSIEEIEAYLRTHSQIEL